jgi:hypothetical protein
MHAAGRALLYIVAKSPNEFVSFELLLLEYHLLGYNAVYFFESQLMEAMFL